jgi:hypothetical protein
MHEGCDQFSLYIPETSARHHLTGWCSGWESNLHQQISHPADFLASRHCSNVLCLSGGQCNYASQLRTPGDSTRANLNQVTTKERPVSLQPPWSCSTKSITLEFTVSCTYILYSNTSVQYLEFTVSCTNFSDMIGNTVCNYLHNLCPSCWVHCLALCATDCELKSDTVLWIFFSIRKQPDESLSTLIARIEDGMSNIKELCPTGGKNAYTTSGKSPWQYSTL